MSVFQDIREAAEKKRERVKAEFSRADAHTIEGLKALLALHGGACVAMLGFIQALLAKEKAAAFAAFQLYAKNALLFFAIGLTLAALVPAARVLDIKNSIANIFGAEGHNWWDRAAYLLWGLSWVAFVVGLVFVGRGLDQVLT